MAKTVTVKELFFMLGEEIHKGNADKTVYLGGSYRLNEGDVRMLTGEELRTSHYMFERMSKEELEGIVCIR